MSERDFSGEDGETEADNLLEAMLLTRRTRVLVAEHAGPLRRRIVQCLRDDGHEVVQVHDAADLLACIEPALGNPMDDAPDVVICDAALPGLRNPRLARALGGSFGTPVILIGSVAESEPDAQALRLRAIDVCRSPLDFEDLRAAVTRSLRSTG